jgi:hypothetical protein
MYEWKVLMSMHAIRAGNISASDMAERVSLTMPLPSEDMLYASLLFPDISGLLSFSLEPETVMAGLCGMVMAVAVVAFLRHTNFSKSCSSLDSLS